MANGTPNGVSAQERGTTPGEQGRSRTEPLNALMPGSAAIEAAAEPNKPVSGEATIRLLDCDRKGGTKERRAILEAYRTAIRRIDGTIEFLDGPDRSPNGELGKQLVQHFPTPAQAEYIRATKSRPQLSLSTLDTVRANYTKARTGLASGRFDFECDYKEDLNIACGEFIDAVALRHIHICWNFFTTPLEVQSETLVHEAMHKWVFGRGHPDDDPLHNPEKYADFLRP